MVYVFFTRKWIAENNGLGHPSIMIPPADYLPGKYDFSFLAGLGVHLVVDTVSDSPFLTLGMEIAQYAAPVRVHLVRDKYTSSRDFDYLLMGARRREPESGKQIWPRGWSDQLQLDYERREVVFAENFARLNPPDKRQSA